MQQWLVGLIVAACAAQVVWTLLLPAALRRRVAQALLQRRWPAAVQRRLQAAARPSPGCGCDGCDAGALRAAARVQAAPTVQAVQWAPRRRR
jgi:hypothetical protein